LSPNGARVSTEYLIPSIPPGDLFVPISRALILVRSLGRYLAEQLLQWRDTSLVVLKRLWSSISEWRMAEWIECTLNRWHNALLILLLLGLLVAWWGGISG
jgi:hypothetical protein